MLTRQNKPDRDAEFCKGTDYNHIFNNEQINLVRPPMLMSPGNRHHQI